ncbi:hypothetical protein GCM10007276_31210 [Agaricicola taiwanensis]|uniref:DUF3108 domain-containing protein n=1 Tax=Agaricicola taiwanensis TaxID=591372 RepID=A0A8J2YLQ0_9RHOB|nr:hypothetical protein GCM10007276_31210 [Agaricicola taiwanensis]
MRRLVPAALMSVGLAALSLPAAAQTATLTTRYDIRWLNFAPIGKAFMTLDVTNDSTYDAKISGRVLSADVAVTASGNVSGTRVLPETFATTVATSRRRQTIQMGMAAGNVKLAKVTPEPKPRPDRIELSPEHQRGILDPLSAAFMPMPQKDGKLGASACQRTLPVFEGSERFDIQLSYLRMASVEKGESDAYSGPAVVCRARYKAIAGHRESADYVAYFAKDPLIEVWLVPVAGTKMLVPYKTSVPTPFGTIVVEASRFKVEGPKT